jgi:hypothetical protein
MTAPLRKHHMPETLPTQFPLPGRDDLCSGDLLFPKHPEKSIVAALPDLTLSLENRASAEGYNSLRLGELLGSEAPQDRELQTYMALLQERMVSAFGAELGSALQALDLPLVLELHRLLLGEVMDQAMPDVKDFNLTVGHVAMLFEESGEWLVMEAGCTDYSHYRVSIAPYWDAEDAIRPQGQKRSWAMRRADLGQSVWTARHQEFKPDKLPLVLAECKNWLGVPYGILEPGMMTNPDRIYCSELVQRGFDKAQLTIDQNQNWAWVLARLAASGAPLATSPLVGIFDLLAPRFPLLSPAMIYDGPLMTPSFKPRNADGGVLEYMR